MSVKSGSKTVYFCQFLLKTCALLQILVHFVRVFAHFLPNFSYLFYPNYTNQPANPHFFTKNKDLPSKTQDFIEEFANSGVNCSF
jgi:hypothetical protein